MPGRKPNLGRRTRKAEAQRRAVQQAIANQTEEERASAKERKRRRITQIRAEERAERRAARLEKARLRARRWRAAASDLRVRQHQRDKLSVAERRQQEMADQYQTQLRAQQSHDYNHFASLTWHVLIGTMPEECPYCRALTFNGETKRRCCATARKARKVPVDQTSERVSLPQNVCNLLTPKEELDEKEEFDEKVFPNIQTNYKNHDSLSEQAIPAVKKEDVCELNSFILSNIKVEADTCESDYENHDRLSEQAIPAVKNEDVCELNSFILSNIKVEADTCESVDADVVADEAVNYIIQQNF